MSNGWGWAPVRYITRKWRWFTLNKIKCSQPMLASDVWRWQIHVSHIYIHTLQISGPLERSGTVWTINWLLILSCKPSNQSCLNSRPIRSYLRPYIAQLTNINNRPLPAIIIIHLSNIELIWARILLTVRIHETSNSTSTPENNIIKNIFQIYWI